MLEISHRRTIFQPAQSLPPPPPFVPPAPRHLSSARWMFNCKKSQVTVCARYFRALLGSLSSLFVSSLFLGTIFKQQSEAHSSTHRTCLKTVRPDSILLYDHCMGKLWRREILIFYLNMCMLQLYEYKTAAINIYELQKLICWQGV